MNTNPLGKGLIVNPKIGNSRVNPIAVEPKLEVRLEDVHVVEDEGHVNEAEMEEMRNALRLRRNRKRRQSYQRQKARWDAAKRNKQPVQAKVPIQSFGEAGALKELVELELKTALDKVSVAEVELAKAEEYVETLKGVIKSLSGSVTVPAKPVKPVVKSVKPVKAPKLPHGAIMGRGATQRCINILKENDRPMHTSELVRAMGKVANSRAVGSLAATLSGALRSNTWKNKIERVAPSVYKAK